VFEVDKTTAELRPCRVNIPASRKRELELVPDTLMYVFFLFSYSPRLTVPAGLPLAGIILQIK
jgi:hypothetical protein